jgi:RNA polymerase sigma-70 factor (ECF subfamily)
MIQDIMAEVNRREQLLESLREASDEEILVVSRVQPDAFVLLVERYEDAFLRKARSILYSQEDAEEIVQDTFTRIYVYADRYKPQEGAKFSSWAYSILTRLAFTRYQKLKKSRARTADLDPEDYERLPDTQDAFMENLTIRDEVLLALSKMPETAARLLRLQFIEGKTQDEIATLEGTSVGAIKTRVHRAKDLFRKSFATQRTHDES